MPFTILVEEEKDGIPEFTWRNGQPRPHPNSYPWYLEATGNELTRVRKLFENIPITTGTTCKWYGELAKFIFNNLPLD